MRYYSYPNELTPNDKEKLSCLYKKLAHNTKYYAGYPPNTEFDYSELYKFLQFSINNLGDAFIGGNEMSSHRIECEVLTFFAQLTNAPKRFSGYVTNGSTEGNLYGLYLGRKKYPNAIVYFSDHTHYSIPKNLDIMQMPFKVIPTLHNGEINYHKLEQQLKQNNKHPALIIVNIGTTMVSAIDDIDKIKQALANARISNYFLHLDAAFNGMILPFVDSPPPFKFSDGADSIVISGHKFIGTPIPCGIVLTKQEYVDAISSPIVYVKKPDTTISGSRNGVTPLLLWYAIQRIGKKGFAKIIQNGFSKAEYALDLFKENKIPAWKNKYSLTVVFPELSARLLTKWNVPTGHGYSHITALPKLTKQMIDELCCDIVEDLRINIHSHKTKLSTQLIY